MSGGWGVKGGGKRWREEKIWSVRDVSRTMINRHITTDLICFFSFDTRFGNMKYFIFIFVHVYHTETFE